jgi:hypothetical protein
MRLVTVPRDTPSLCARVATLVRASTRSRAISCWSVSPSGERAGVSWAPGPQSDRQSLPLWQECAKIGDLNIVIAADHPNQCRQWLHSPPHHHETTMTTLLTPTDVPTSCAHQGIGRALRGMAGYIEADFLRWQRVRQDRPRGQPFADGVIELMPIADASRYSFKYVNGHPRNGRHGLPTVMAFGVLADVSTGNPELVSRTDADHRAAHRGHLGDGRPGPGAARQPHDGADRQRRAERVPGAGLPPPAGYRHEVRLFDTDPGGHRKLQRQPAARAGLRAGVRAARPRPCVAPIS